MAYQLHHPFSVYWLQIRTPAFATPHIHQPRKLTLMHYYHLILRSDSSFVSVPVTTLVAEKFISELWFDCLLLDLFRHSLVWSHSLVSLTFMNLSLWLITEQVFSKTFCWFEAVWYFLFLDTKAASLWRLAQKWAVFSLHCMYQVTFNLPHHR